MNMTKTKNKFKFSEAISRLEEINEWFQNEEIDLDKGLKKLKEGNSLIKECRKRLKKVENEFIKIKQETIKETESGNAEED